MTIGCRIGDVDVYLLGGATAVPEEQGEYKRRGHNGQQDDQDQCEAGESQVVARPDLLVEEQREPTAAVWITSFRNITLVHNCFFSQLSS